MNPSNPSVPHLDVNAVQRERRLWGGHAPWLHDVIGEQMAERLSWFKAEVADWMDWEPWWGGAKGAEAVSAHFPRARRWVFDSRPDFSPAKPARRWPWSPRVAAWDGRQPVDLLWANMGLRGVTSPDSLMQQWLARLKPEGILMFSALGPHTFDQLRVIYEQHGWGQAMSPLTDMHDWGDMLVEASFKDPVLDTSFLNLTYSDSGALLRDLRTVGVNTHPERFPACRGTQWYSELKSALQSELPKDTAGRLVLKVEVVWGQAVAPVGVAARAGETAISMDRMRGMLREPRSK